MSPPLLAARGLSFGYEPGRPVLTGVNMKIESGRRLAVVGPNGGGKTTLFRLLVGALAPVAGEIEIAGRPLRRSRAGLLALRQQVQLVLQDPDDQLFAATVYQDVSFGPTNLGLSPAQVHDRVTTALVALDIIDLAERPTHLLSYGQRKRAAIAGAVALRPGLLILDEPTAGLDPTGVEALLDTLADLHRGGTTLVLSTHDVDLAYRWADEVAVVADQTVRTAAAAAVLTDARLLAAAGLTPAWAPLVRRLLDRCPGLAGGHPRTPIELAHLLSAAGPTKSGRTGPDPTKPGPVGE